MKKLKKIALRRETIRVLKSLDGIIGGEPIVRTNSDTLCTLSAGFSFCPTICVHGTGCSFD